MRGMKMRMNKLAALGWVGACLALGAGPLAAAEDTKPRTPTEFNDQMARQGWKEITPGVLQRFQAGERTETFAYGKEGLQWALTAAQNRLAFFLQDYRRYPTEDGVTAIVEQRQEVKRLERALAAAASDKSVAIERFLNAGCDFSFGYSASAYPLTTSQGVGAQANAYFNNSSCSGSANCGYVGDVYAYTYVSARTGTTTTTQYQRDPLSGDKSGTAVTSSSTLTLNGTADCYSEASSSVTVAALGIYLSGYASNSSCPAQTLQVTAINGSTYVYRLGTTCQTVTWTASVTGGTPAYGYKWYFNGAQVSTASSYSRTFCGPGYYTYTSYPLSVTVTDALNVQASRSTTVVFETAASGGTGGGGGCLAAAAGTGDSKLQQLPCP